MKSTAGMLAILAFATPAWGTAYYVSPGGSDGNNGLTEAAAFEHVQRAGDLMLAGDTVYVMNGTYVEPTPGSWWNGIHAVRSGTESARITFRNYPGHTPVIDPQYQSAGLGNNGESWIVYDGFKVIHGGDDAKGCIHPGENFLVQNCHASNVRSPAPGAHANCFRIQNESGARRSGVTIYNCRGEDAWLQGGGGDDNAVCVMLYYTGDVTVQNCDFSDATSGVMDKRRGRDNRYLRNFFHHTEGNGWKGPIHGDTSPLENPQRLNVYENIFCQTDGLWTQNGATNCHVYNNSLTDPAASGRPTTAHAGTTTTTSWSTATTPAASTDGGATTSATTTACPSTPTTTASTRRSR